MAAKSQKKAVLEDAFLAAWDKEFPQLPKPVRQFPVKNPKTGCSWKLDFSWPEWKIAVEIQGGSFVRGGHNTAMGQASDYERHNYLTGRDWKVIYFSTPMLKDMQEAVTIAAEVLCNAKDILNGN